MKEISVSGFLREFIEQHRTRPDHPFCWILGAGASVSSEIPTAGQLSRRFLACLCEDATGSQANCEEWVKTGALKIPDFDPLDPAKHYPELYERRYGDCPDAGYAFLEDVMRDKRPSYGYAVLALILENTPHRIVITTNFDNLVADALATHSTTFPRVVGHSQLTHFVQTEVRRPLVAKIHGDLGFRMSNTLDEIAELDRPWQEALNRIFQRFTPIVIGYGGNDRTLMKLLRDLPPGIPDRIYWCQWEGEQPAPHVREFLDNKKGSCLVRHPGFDLLMMQLEFELRKTEGLINLPQNLVGHLEKRQAERLVLFREQSEALGKALANTEKSANPKQREGEAQAQERQALAGAAAHVLAGTGGPGEQAKTWWTWVLEAQAAPNAEARDKIYREAIESLPSEANLLSSYAIFLCNDRHDLDRAEEFFKRAIDADPKRAISLGNYAIFLRKDRHDLDSAEEFYKRAIDADPKHATNLGNYATFLLVDRHDPDRAEEFCKRAIDADPKHATNLGNYAIFLRDERHDLDRAGEFYKRAIDADPKHATNLGNYATFLRIDRRNLDRAEEFFKRAIDADPKHAGILGDYATFLGDERHDLDRAEEFYKRAVDADSKDATNLGNYATFLRKERRDLDHANELYSRAVDADPKHATNLGNYATFLLVDRHDVDRAEELFKRALDADPKHAINLSNYASFLRNERHDLGRAEEFCRRAIDADPKHANSLVIYALLLWQERRDIDRAEELFKRALDADPRHANSLGIYASFLWQERRDIDHAEELFKRAIDAEPKHASNLGAFAPFIWRERRDFNRAEELFNRAIDANPRHASSLGNFAQYLLAQGRRAEGAEMLTRAFAGLDRSDTLLSELWFYAYAHAPDRWPDALGRLKGLLLAGARSKGWVLSENVKRAREDGHPEPDLVAGLADVIAGKAEITMLDQFAAWQEVPPIRPEARVH